MNAELYEETINQLKQENVELRCRLQTVNEECILLDKENRDLKEENAILNKQLTNLQKEHDDLLEEVLDIFYHQMVESCSK